MPARARAEQSTTIASSGGTPLVVAERPRLLGVIHLKDIVKGGIKERFAELRRDGHQDGDDHRRQPADRRRHRGRGRAWTISWPRPRPKPSSS